MKVLNHRERLSISVLLALIPFAFLLVLVWRCFVDVPFLDEWEMVPRLQKLNDGTFTFLDLWQQHNEHRPLFGIAVVLALVRATRWNTAAEIAANVVAGSMIFGVFVRQIVSEWPAGYRLPLWLIPVLSLFAFSPSQWENWLWGWQITIFVNVLAVVTGLALLTRLEGRWTRLAGALLCAIVATYSFASGLIVWVTGAMAWGLSRNQRKPAQLVVWVIVAILTITSYFYDYQPMPFTPTVQSGSSALDLIGPYVTFVMQYTGAAVAIYDPSLAAVAGWAGLTLFVYLAFNNRDLVGTPIFSFTVLICLHGLAVAGFTSLGRSGYRENLYSFANYGTDQALVSRYITISTPLWLAIFVLAALQLSRLRINRATGIRSTVQEWVMSVALVAILAATVASGEWGTRMSNARRDLFEPARRALITGQDDELLGRLYPLALIRDRREKLIAWHLSVFRSARAQKDSLERR